MHRSRLVGLSIDCRTDDLDAAADFWSAVLGRPRLREEDARYVVLTRPDHEPHIEVQRVEHDSRVHLDIESDDVDAEVRRLEALGARRLQQVRDWWIMEAPTGQRFCVVPAESEHFAETANRWD